MSKVHFYSSCSTELFTVLMVKLYVWRHACCVCVCKIVLFKGPEVSEGLMVAGQAG